MAGRFIRGCTSLPRGVEVEKGEDWERERERQREKEERERDRETSDRASSLHERRSLEFQRLRSGLRFDNLYARGPWSFSSCRASGFPPFVWCTVYVPRTYIAYRTEIWSIEPWCNRAMKRVVCTNVLMRIHTEDMLYLCKSASVYLVRSPNITISLT